MPSRALRSLVLVAAPTVLTPAAAGAFRRSRRGAVHHHSIFRYRVRPASLCCALALSLAASAIYTSTAMAEPMLSPDPAHAAAPTKERVHPSAQATTSTARNSLVVTKLGSATGDASFYNTFGPWDQHVVYDGAYGIFAVYHTTQNEESDPGCHCGYFRVVRSRDGGSTWTTVYNSQTHGTLVQDPAIDKDSNGNIYVTGNVYNASVGGGWQTNIWRFQAGSIFLHAPAHTGQLRLEQVLDDL